MQDRCDAWIARGLSSGKGRRKGLISGGSSLINSIADGTSIFNPALCELLIMWFSKNGDKILDPFAGGSTRGIVAKLLGREYTGIDLRNEQIIENKKNAQYMGVDGVDWICGDSDNVLNGINDGTYDFILSCPPYAALEVYSDDKNDLSNMPYDAFLVKYNSIIKKSVSKLSENRFIAWVVGEVRDKKGIYYNFISDTIRAFVNAGAAYYNEAILLNNVGTGAIRANNTFKTRKLVKVHQNILIFSKGNPKLSAKRLGDIDLNLTLNEK